MSLYSAIEPERAQLWLPLRDDYVNSGGLRVVSNLGRATGAPTEVILGDGVTATTFPTQFFPRGRSFDGGDYMDAGASACNWTLATGFTLAALISVKRGSTGSLLARRQAAGSTQYDWYVDAASRQVRAYDGVNTLSGPEVAGRGVVAATMVYSGATCSLYADEVTTGPLAFSVPASVVVNTYIGAYGIGASGRLTGHIRCLAAFPYPLTQLQVAELSRRMKMYARLP